MKNVFSLSDEILGAYIDGEIDGDELEQIIAMETADKSLAVKIYKMRKLKHLVKAARAPELELVSSSILKKSKKNNYLYYKIKYLNISCLAALLIVSFVFIYSYIDISVFQQPIFSKTASLNENRLLSEVSSKQNLNLVMHLKTEKLDSADQMLNLLETLLTKSRKHKNNLHVEVIVSGPGFYLLQKELSKNGAKIRILKQEYQNLTFLACGETLQRLEDKSGKDIQIIEEAMLIVSGREWIKKRKASGWAYFLI